MELISSFHHSIMFEDKASGQCCKTFYCSNLLPFHGNYVILSYKTIYYLDNYCGVAVNYNGKNSDNIGPWWKT